jgi:hypothetical protein
MPFRKLLIRVMLWSLGVTAVAGAAAALLSTGNVGWRVVATGLTTAAAAGLMLPFSILADKSGARREGLAGMALVVFEFIGALGLIWRVFESLGAWDLEQKAGLTMVWVGMTALPAILFLRFTSAPTARAAGRAGVGLCGLVFVLLMLGTWGPDEFWHNWKLFATAGAIASIGILGVGSLAGVGSPPQRVWRWGGVIASVVAAVMAVVAIWKEIHSGSGWFSVVVSLAAVVAHANVCLFVPLTAAQKWVRTVTILAAVATAALVDAMVFAEEGHFDLPLGQNLAAAAGIIASCGSLALLVLARLNRNLDRVPVLSEVREMTVICPGCQKKQTLSVGDSACATCGLKFHIRVEEPRCPTCDYVLFMLQSDRCPECGTVVRGDSRDGGDRAPVHAAVPV